MNRFITILYEIALWLIALVAIPKILFNYFVHKKYQQSLAKRFGMHFPDIKKNNHPVIWIHAVSMGETKAVSTLAKEIKKQNPNSILVISSTTETGHAEAKRSLSFADHFVYLPLDLYCIVKKVIKKASPSLIILCETDLWFNFLRCAKNGGASIALVNGKLSEPSMKRFCKVGFFSKRLFDLFDVLCLQNSLYKERFLEAGAPPEKIVVTGNLKLDEEYPRLSDAEVEEWKNRFGIKPDQLVLTIGSTHDPEEQIMIDVLKDVWKKTPNLKVLLVPRHPERFKDVTALLKKNQVTTINYTDIANAKGDEQVILIDAMGKLRMCYQLSDIALVGGSYTSRVGGHNILEPCWYGKPVLFGPHMHTQTELVDMVDQYQAGNQVSPDQLGDYLNKWIENSAEREAIGQRGVNMIKDLRGSTKRTLVALEPLLSTLEKK